MLLTSCNMPDVTHIMLVTSITYFRSQKGYEPLSLEEIHSPLDDPPNHTIRLITQTFSLFQLPH